MADNSKSIDMAQAPYRTIWRLAWPQILMMLFHFCIGMADVWVAGKINREVQASLGIITQSLFFMLVLAIAVANGSVAAISQSVGAGLFKRVRRYVGLCLQLALLMGSTMLCLGFLLRDPLLVALRIPEEMRYVTDYFLSVYLMVLPSYNVLTITNAIFRAQKKVMFPLYSMMTVTIVNTILDLGLGLGWFGMPNIGYKGLAWATFGSVTAGALVNVFVLWRQGVLKAESFAPYRWVKKALPYLIKVAWPSGLMQIVWHSGYLVLYAITASLPFGKVDALAGMAVGLRIESLLFLPAFAFNMTAGILVGHYLGARQPEEAKNFGWKIIAIGATLLSVMTAIVWQWVEPAVGLLTQEPEVIRQAAAYLKWNMLALPFTVTGMIVAGVFNGAGATLYNMIVMGSATWALRLPLAYALGHFVLKDAQGIWIAMFASQVVQASLFLYTFAFRNWQKFSMIKARKNDNRPNGANNAPRI